MLSSVPAVCLIRLWQLVATGIAIVVIARIWSDSLDLARDYHSLAAKVLIVSFVPDVALAMMHGFGGGWPEALALMVMHATVWAICVTMLPALCWAHR
jgi:hypothetical protein